VLKDARTLQRVTELGYVALRLPASRSRNFTEPDRTSNPLGLLSLAMAARGGVIDNLPASQLVAAGLSILQRCAPLARALYGKRSAILLPTGPLFLTAIAASDGRGALLLDPNAAAADIAAHIHDADVGAVFTMRALSRKIQAGLPMILLDCARRSAAAHIRGATVTIDLDSHAGCCSEVWRRRTTMTPACAAMRS
jgi:hypothetical protein